MKKLSDVIKIAASAALLLPLTLTSGWTQGAQGEALYAALLQSNVQGGMVDYAGFQKDAEQLDAYIDYLAQVHPASLSPSDQMAFYINAYNAWTIKLILTRYPNLTSIKELGTLFQTPWKKKFVKLNGETVTLDHIEHDILRPLFKDPRIHFAINCASKSCPPLLAEPYRGDRLEDQLERVTKGFINDGASNYLKGDTLFVSKIFKWFRQDFNDDVVGFIKLYAEGDLAKQLNTQAAPKVEYLDYDWSLNDV